MEDGPDRRAGSPPRPAGPRRRLRPLFTAPSSPVSRPDPGGPPDARADGTARDASPRAEGLHAVRTQRVGTTESSATQRDICATAVDPIHQVDSDAPVNTCCADGVSTEAQGAFFDATCTRSSPTCHLARVRSGRRSRSSRSDSTAAISVAGFSAQVVNNANTFSAGTMQLKESNGSINCYSTGSGSGGTVSAANSANCSINKLVGTLDQVPAGTPLTHDDHDDQRGHDQRHPREPRDGDLLGGGGLRRQRICGQRHGGLLRQGRLLDRHHAASASTRPMRRRPVRPPRRAAGRWPASASTDLQQLLDPRRSPC